MTKTLKNKSIIFLICAVFFVVLFIYYFFSSASYKTIISMEKIPQVLRVNYAPVVPNTWEIKSIEKYDDGFISPFVIITYKNDIRLDLTTSNLDLYFTKTISNKIKIMLGDRHIDYYYDDKKVGYALRINRVGYAFFAPINLKIEVEDTIQDLK